jgi:phosphomannomutase
MADAPLMIGVSGLRGVAGESLTAGVAARFAAAFGSWLVERGSHGLRVVIGSDGRVGHEVFLGAAIRGLEAAGCEVTSLGVAMTPTIGVMADRLDAQGAMIVTASHNPQEWNGLKCLVRSEGGAGVVSACAPSADDAKQIIDRFHEMGDDSAGLGAGAKGSASHDAAGGGAASGGQAHVELVQQSLDLVAEAEGIGAARFPVVLDSVCGSGCVPGRALLDAFGCDTRHIHGEQTGVFPHTPEPLRENLTDLCEAVRASGASVGFAQDPDADRLAIVDENGAYIGEEYTLVLTAMALLGSDREQESRGQAVVCTNLSTSRMIDDVAQRFGARVVRTAVGEANVVEAMKREAAAGTSIVFGGEGNGGVIWPRVTYVRDSLSAMALLLGLMAKTGNTVSQLVASIPHYAIEKRKAPIASKADADPACEAVARHWSSVGSSGGASGGASGRIDRQDGVRVDLDDERAWLHVRASNTEPIMRLIAEAPTASAAAAILDEAERVIAGS